MSVHLTVEVNLLDVRRVSVGQVLVSVKKGLFVLDEGRKGRVTDRGGFWFCEFSL